MMVAVIRCMYVDIVPTTSEMSIIKSVSGQQTNRHWMHNETYTLSSIVEAEYKYTILYLQHGSTSNTAQQSLLNVVTNGNVVSGATLANIACQHPYTSENCYNSLR